MQDAGGNTERFTGRVELYERYRTRYPKAVLDVLAEACGLQAKHVIADVGAGTGMLAELFLQNGNAVQAIEPNTEMRAACARMEERWSKLRVKDGTAEATGLEAESMDFITAGRAFHWFDLEGAKKEFRRVLRTEGWVVLVSDSRVRDEAPQAMSYETMLREHGTDYEENRERYVIDAKARALFAGGTYAKRTMLRDERLTMEAFAGQTMSLSVTPPVGHAKYEGMQRALREHFERWATEGRLTIPTACRVMWGQMAPPAASRGGGISTR